MAGKAEKPYEETNDSSEWGGSASDVIRNSKVVFQTGGDGKEGKMPYQES